MSKLMAWIQAHLVDPVTAWLDRRSHAGPGGSGGGAEEPPVGPTGPGEGPTEPPYGTTGPTGGSGNFPGPV
jgi:hypothetical protein